MFTILHKLKSQFALLLAAIIGFLALYISVLKQTALKRTLKREKGLSKGRDKANEALNKGIDNENKPTGRGYFDDK